MDKILFGNDFTISLIGIKEVSNKLKNDQNSEVRNISKNTLYLISGFIRKEMIL